MKKYLIVIIHLIIVLMLIMAITSCDDMPEDNEQPIVRTYGVRLSNFVGSDWYQCDTVIWIADNRVLLKNREDSCYFVDITVPANVVVRIYPNNIPKREIDVANPFKPLPKKKLK